LSLFALVVLGSRIVFLPPTLEDLDSVNFSLSLREFAPTLHQPHPPGYPVYVALAKAVNAVVPDPARALALLSGLAQALLVFPLYALLLRLARSPATAAAALVLYAFSPAVWFNGARPMSDSAGLLFAVSAQALLLRGLEGERRALLVGALLAGLGIGVRLQSLLLTLPVGLLALARGPGARLAGAAAFGGGALSCVVAVTIASGGVANYLASTGAVFGGSAVIESLVLGFTPNRAAHAVIRVTLGPWVDTGLGVAVLSLALLGAVVTAVRRPRALALGLLLFAPYFAFHTLVQWVESVRYTMLYLPLLAWLAVEAIAWLTASVPERLRAATLWSIVGGLAAWCAAVTLPALAAYSAVASPPVAALRAVDRIAQAGVDAALAGHSVFHRYCDVRRTSLPSLRGRPMRSLRPVLDYWRNGGRRNLLFLVEPGRTDLELLDSGAPRPLGEWSYPAVVEPFLPGARPRRAELFRLKPPLWFAESGWHLSAEAGPLAELARQAERRAYLRPLAEPSFLMVSGEPVAPASAYRLELRLGSRVLADLSCADPLLRGFALAPEPGPVAAGYQPLLALTRFGDAPRGAPFLLKGLAYGPATSAGVVHGRGWFIPEPDERGRTFRWTSRAARSLVHVPQDGVRVRVEGLVPLEYVGAGARVALRVDGQERASLRADQRRFRLEAWVVAGPSAFRELTLTAERSFVPDRIQLNGDRRRLALRVYRFRLERGAGGSAVVASRRFHP
jgi:hypothetical protein